MEDRALCRAPAAGSMHPRGQATEEARRGSETWCPRDHMHPWLWLPFRAQAWTPAQGWSPQVPLLLPPPASPPAAPARTPHAPWPLARGGQNSTPGGDDAVDAKSVCAI